MKNFFRKLNLKLQNGQSLVEILLTMGLAAIILPALLTGLVASRHGKAQQAQRTQAVYLLNETIDAVRSVREKGWTGFAVNGTFHTAISGSNWTLVPGSTVSAGLTQQVTISDLSRDSNGAIATIGGTLDPSSKKVDVAISWGQPYLSTVSATLFITRYLENNSFTQTTVADFNVGTRSGTTVTNTAGGEVTLGAGGQGDWCKPQKSNIATLDLTGQALPTALYTIVDNSTAPPNNYAYLTTGENSSSYTMESVKVTDPQSGIPVPSEYKQYTQVNYHAYGLFVDASYAYLGTSHPGATVDIVQINGATYTETGTFGPSGNPTGLSVYVSGTVGYVTGDNKIFYSFDLSSKSGSRATQGTYTLPANGNKVIINGSYAYIVTTATTNQLQIINVSDPNHLTLTKSFDLGNGLAGVTLAINGSAAKAYIVTKYAAGKSNFFVVDISNPSAPVIKGSTNTNVMIPNDITLATGNRAIVVGSGGTQQYHAFNISTDTPSFCGGASTDNPAIQMYAVSTVLEADGDAYSYFLTNEASKEFRIIAGGPGGQYVASGTFESNTFNPGYSTAINRFDVSVNRLIDTNIEFQVALKQAIGSPPSCTGVTFSGADFVGPSGTGTDRFQTTVTSGTQVFSYVIPSNINPGQCFRYKVYLSTTNSVSTPIFYDITVNYSP